jgi:hypothetical protein
MSRIKKQFVTSRQQAGKPHPQGKGVARYSGQSQTTEEKKKKQSNRPHCKKIRPMDMYCFIAWTQKKTALAIIPKAP